MLPILLCWPAMSEADVGGMVVEIKPSHKPSQINFAIYESKTQMISMWGEWIIVTIKLHLYCNKLSVMLNLKLQKRTIDNISLISIHISLPLWDNISSEEIRSWWYFLFLVQTVVESRENIKRWKKKKQQIKISLDAWGILNDFISFNVFSRIKYDC